MGRRKIEIAPLSDDRNRSVTFAKRKQGLMKKAYELGVLCNAEVAVVIFAQNGKPYEFSSIGNIDSTLLRYSNLSDGAIESKGPEDFGGVTPAHGQGGSKTSHQEEEEDEMELEDHTNGRADDGSHYSGSETAAPTSKRRKVSQPASGEAPGHQSQSVEPSAQPAEGSPNGSPYDRGAPNHPPSVWPPQSGYTMPTSYAQLPPSFLSTQLAHMQRTYPFLPGLENLQALQMPNLFYGMPPNPGFNPGNPGPFYPPGKTARSGDPFDRLPNGTAPEPGHPLEIPRGITDLGAAIPRPPRAASPIEEGHRAPPPSGTFEDYLSNLDGHAGPSFRWPGQEEPADATAAFREKRAAGELAVEGEAKSARTEE